MCLRCCFFPLHRIIIIIIITIRIPFYVDDTMAAQLVELLNLPVSFEVSGQTYSSAQTLQIVLIALVYAIIRPLLKKMWVRILGENTEELGGLGKVGQKVPASDGTAVKVTGKNTSSQNAGRKRK